MYKTATCFGSAMPSSGSYSEQSSRSPTRQSSYYVAFIGMVKILKHWNSRGHCATIRKVAGSIPDDVIGIFHWYKTFQSHYGPGVDSAYNRNEYQEYFLGGKGGRCVRLTTLPPSCADCLEVWEPQPPGTLRACNGIAFIKSLKYTKFISKKLIL
jgi:hypothetical protein